MDSVPTVIRMLIFGPPLLGLGIIIHAAIVDLKDRILDTKPPRDINLDDALNYVLETKQMDGKVSGQQLLAMIQQEARDEMLTVWARRSMGLIRNPDRDILEPVDPAVFSLHGFRAASDGHWSIGSPQGFVLYGSDFAYYDPMFNKAEIKSFYRRMRKTVAERSTA